MTKVIKSEQEWAQQLSDEEFEVARRKGTEAPFTGRYWNTTEEGVYHCICCDAALFSSATKFDAGCGWPSFYDSLDSANIKTEDDFSRGMHRVEIMCANCDSHLGHVFPDGPQPTGDRYCVNSLSLNFNEKEQP